MKIKSWCGSSPKTQLSVAPTSLCWMVLVLPLRTPVFILPTWHSRLFLFFLPSCSPPTGHPGPPLLRCCFPGDDLPLHPRGFSPLMTAGPSLPPTAPCASSSWPLLQPSWHSPFHEMAHFANTLLFSGPSPHGVYLLCFPSWYLCFPYGSLLSLLFWQVSQGLLFQENVAAALGKLVFLSIYSL